ncbi:ABC transporter permease [Lachnoclostridium pacaense]|uniref:ABC transporter permease n=1 Tax=Enterocloster hominis (ex Hitch et al. 2024) TaxID=1917870 RepID=UPI00102F2F94|nr:ABC transporter permease [Lachnoclostridium pacaense]MCC2815990.1 ABC transporter permease [Lachnoclostridium pacaense]
MKMNGMGESSLLAETFARIWKNKGARVGVILLALITISCAAASLLAPYGVNEMDLANMFATPSGRHIFGTDAMGRDLFSRLLYGGRYSLALGICAALFSAVMGCIIGSIAGYFGGRTETVIMRFLDIWSSLPGMLLCILISAVLGAGFFNTVLALAIGNVPIDVRLIRGQILSERSKDYLEAAQSINCSHLSIMFRHILPNVVSPVIVDATMNIGMNITMAAALSYIGLGVQPPTPEWGAMLADARTHILNYPHLIMFPGIVIALTVLAINLIGDGLRDAMDPKLRS